MKEAGKLDFFVIGAQKAGTTSLHYHLKRHPGIALPVEKEAPFFSREEALSRGLGWYIEEFFPKASAEQLLGSVTPQYMGYPGVAEQMWQHCPDAKIIAMLRDPVERARSHYKMRVRAFGEKRQFQQAILEQLKPQALFEARENPTPSNSFVIWGEYGRILSNFLSRFPHNQLLVTFLSDFEKDPNKVLASIYRFLGLEMLEEREPGKRYNASRDQSHSSISAILANKLQNRVLRRLGKKIIPVRFKRRLVFWSIINRNNPQIDVDIGVDLSDEVLSMLSSHYLSDLKYLDDIIFGEIPWSERIEHDSEIGEGDER